MLEIYDDLFTSDFLVKLTSICYELPWQYTVTSNRYQYPSSSILCKGANNNKFFGSRLYHRKDYNLIINDAPDEFFEVLNFFSKTVKKNFQLNVIDTNLQVKNQDGDSHRDLGLTSGDTRSIIFYPHFEWDTSWGGNLEIYNENQQLIDEYKIKPGRIIFLDSSVWHKAKGPLVHGIARISIVFRVTELSNNQLQPFSYN